MVAGLGVEREQARLMGKRLAQGDPFLAVLCELRPIRQTSSSQSSQPREWASAITIAARPLVVE